MIEIYKGNTLATTIPCYTETMFNVSCQVLTSLGYSKYIAPTPESPTICYD